MKLQNLFLEGKFIILHTFLMINLNWIDIYNIRWDARPLIYSSSKWFYNSSNLYRSEYQQNKLTGLRLRILPSQVFSIMVLDPSSTMRGASAIFARTYNVSVIGMINSSPKFFSTATVTIHQTLYQPVIIENSRVQYRWNSTLLEN